MSQAAIRHGHLQSRVLGAMPRRRFYAVFAGHIQVTTGCPGT